MQKEKTPLILLQKSFFRVKDKDEYGTQTIKIEKFNGVDSELNNLEASLPTIQISVVSDIVPTPNPTAEPTEAPTAKPTSKPSGNTNNSTDPTSTQQQLRQYQKVLCLLQHLK